MGLRLYAMLLCELRKKHKVYLILTTFVHSEDNKTSLLFSPKENNTNLFQRYDFLRQRRRDKKNVCYMMWVK